MKMTGVDGRDDTTVSGQQAIKIHVRLPDVVEIDGLPITRAFLKSLGEAVDGNGARGEVCLDDQMPADTGMEDLYREIQDQHEKEIVVVAFGLLFGNA